MDEPVSSHLEKAEDIDFITKTAIERDPKKRRVKPVETQSSILDFDLGESSDDSDFRIEDHPEISDDDSMDSNCEEAVSESTDDEEDNSSSDLDDIKVNLPSNGLSVADIIQKANAQSKNLPLDEKAAQLLICCGCLGDQSDGINEIVECDSCGVTVHEACYGITDSASLSSTDSLSPTAAWFCEACTAGVKTPICELCPNSGGIFKETDVGKWVHLVCALYIPGVAFGEVDKLSNVTLFEMPYNKWGAKPCSLCVDDRFARTGVCIGCDAGLCRNFFHVTCAQREGFLSEAHTEEVDQADPFYAHCKLHSDKTLVKRRKRNYLALQLRMHYRKLQFLKGGHNDTPEQLRINKKLSKSMQKYLSNKIQRTPPWVPTQKMPRLLTTSASACRKLLKKAELMGIDTSQLEMQETQITTLMDIRRKWHIPPAFTVEFIAYYLDRNDRLKGMQDSLEELIVSNKVLNDEQKSLRDKYEEVSKEHNEELAKSSNLKELVTKCHDFISYLCPNKKLPNIEDIGKPIITRQPQNLVVPTAAALKMGVGFPLNNIPSNRNDRVLSSHARNQDPLLLHECATCKQKRDQHLLAKCDTCHLYYHLNCLNPPLLRLPKKSKQYGWQCSECDKTSDSEVELNVAPRRSRGRFSKDKSDQESSFTPKVKIKPLERPSSSPKNEDREVEMEMMNSMVNNEDVSFNNSCNVPVEANPVDTTGLETILITSVKSGKKRRRDKHKNRYSPELGGSVREHKRKRKKKSIDLENPNPPHPRITIKIKPIPLPAGEVASRSNPQCFYVNNENNDPPPPIPIIPIVTPIIPPEPPILQQTKDPIGSPTCTCDVCKEDCYANTSVNCDECKKGYHFTCLDPPLKKTPKRRGYSWHCADCDPTEVSPNNHFFGDGSKVNFYKLFLGISLLLISGRKKNLSLIYRKSSFHAFFFYKSIYT
nr:PHD finger protein 14 isoform X1 [Onthophagus taurus]